LQFFDYSDPFNEDYNLGNENPLYTFDNNGAPREEYFTYYNLACLYSIQNKLDSSFNYLKEALEHGYPYLNHLFNDVDLSNLLNSSDYTRNQIQKIYDDGFINKFSGETYINSYASYSANYIFINDTDIRKSVSNESNSSYYGIYEIKNYNIIINYKRETGRRGYGEIIIATGNGNIYEKYEPYDKEIDESQILSIKKILNSQEWELFTIKRIENSREMVITSIEEILSR